MLLALTSLENLWFEKYANKKYGILYLIWANPVEATNTPLQDKIALLCWYGLTQENKISPFEITLWALVGALILFVNSYFTILLLLTDSKSI